MKPQIIGWIVFIAGFIVGWLIRGVVVGKIAQRLGDRIDIMRIAGGKQDDAIRKKQNRIDELEREVRRLRK